MRINIQNTVGVVVDVQERLIHHIYQHEQVLSRMQILIRGLRILEVPLMLTQQYTKGLGQTTLEIRQELEGVEPVEKKRFSCCGVEEFDRKISTAPYRHVLLMGIETHVCVLQTTLDLLEKGYQPVVVADAVSSRKSKDHEIALERIKSEGGLLTSAESVLFELMGTADTEVFKEISKLVK